MLRILFVIAVALAVIIGLVELTGEKCDSPYVRGMVESIKTEPDDWLVTATEAEHLPTGRRVRVHRGANAQLKWPEAEQVANGACSALVARTLKREADRREAEAWL